ncbi:MAG TPA: branched-chain amino acid ABC transporter substrate-binding protein, partial [Actinomycetota bacterium]|nr:branched-chain amino acid ABC transporter substrate-binding protein [Actinomycetota bacterium]
MKKRFVWMAALSALVLITAACRQQGGQQGDNGTTDGDPCGGEFGCVEYGPNDPIKLGTLLVISGSDASLGQDSQNGAVLALDFRDTPGEVLGHPVEFNHQDDGCSAEGGQAGAQALASDPTIAAVIGTSCSSAALGVADTILSEQGIVLISPSNTGPALTAPETHQPFYLRTAHNDKIQGGAVADFAYNEAGKRKAATIHDGSPYADGLQQVFADNFTRLGGEITAQQAIQVGETDFGPVLTDIAADQPDFLYFPVFVAEG